MRTEEERVLEMSGIGLHSKPSGHFYTKKKNMYPSVTSILGSIPNPELEAWKAKVHNWRKISAAACKTGTEVHNEIEHALMGKPGKVKHKMQMRAFLAWQKETGFYCIETEIKVMSRMGFGGSLDLFGRINDKFFIIDLKTSKQTYPEYLLQLSAYKYAFVERMNFAKIEIGVLRIDKKKELVEWTRYTDEEYKKGIATFLELCKQWHEIHNTQTEYNKKFIMDE